MRAFLGSAGQPMPRSFLVQRPDELRQVGRAALEGGLGRPGRACTTPGRGERCGGGRLLVSRARGPARLCAPPPRAPRPAPQAALHVGFPAVLKPVTGAASFGVLRVDDEAQLMVRPGLGSAKRFRSPHHARARLPFALGWPLSWHGGPGRSPHGLVCPGGRRTASIHGSGKPHPGKPPLRPGRI
jgi:hypothetical protein